MKASIGRVVIVMGHHSNGSSEHPAIITRAWSDAEPSEATVLVNVTILPDCGEPKPQGSIQLFDTKEAAEAHLAAATYKPPVCYWPARV